MVGYCFVPAFRLGKQYPTIYIFPLLQKIYHSETFTWVFGKIYVILRQIIK